MSRHFQHPVQEGGSHILAWYLKYQSCQQFLVDHSQHTKPIQAVAALINILLPFEKEARASSLPGSTRVTLVPYIRRLVVTGFDDPATLRGFFGDDWTEGIGSIHEAERRNYMFAAKSEPWLKVKAQYDMGNGQTVPFLRPPIYVTEGEIVSAEANWSDWLAMQDWMLGPRAPPEET
ncbi:hypothetical protein E4U41_001047 [Claviceps citrina]|nr:hypothetical protein E4U41_001047 [Claviceps citrina]